jgi:hypothetical protein
MEVGVRFEFGISGVCRSDSLKTEARELAKYKLDLMGVQEVGQNKSGAKPARDYSFFYAN